MISASTTFLSCWEQRRIAEAMIFSGHGYPKISGDNFHDDKDLMQKLYEYAMNLGEESAKYCVD